ncbi:MAG: hypothetical protein H6739_39635 [Alphaproteobacteria bacterium]|nr:hypothetical protein [Alphaproteobacteria bacterium]
MDNDSFPHAGVGAPDYTLHLPDIPWDEVAGRIPVEVQLAGGPRYAATFLTLEHVRQQTERDRETGDCLGGRYFWAPRMVFLERLTRDRIRRAVWHMLCTSCLEGPFERMDAIPESSPLAQRPAYTCKIIAYRPWDPDDVNLDVDITLETGERYIPTFFTLRNIQWIMDKDKHTGERDGGLYHWTIDSILVERVVEPLMVRAIEDMLDRGLMARACELYSPYEEDEDDDEEA